MCWQVGFRATFAVCGEGARFLTRARSGWLAALTLARGHGDERHSQRVWSRSRTAVVFGAGVQLCLCSAAYLCAHTRSLVHPLRPTTQQPRGMLMLPPVHAVGAIIIVVINT